VFTGSSTTIQAPHTAPYFQVFVCTFVEACEHPQTPNHFRDIVLLALLSAASSHSSYHPSSYSWVGDLRNRRFRFQICLDGLSALVRSLGLGILSTLRRGDLEIRDFFSLYTSISGVMRADHTYRDDFSLEELFLGRPGRFTRGSKTWCSHH
jgi:hypothetical protein